MYKISTNEHGELIAIGKFGEETIHVIHCAETIEELKEDSYDVYLVAEECTNFARVHLITESSKDEALQKVDEYLREQEGHEHSHLIGVFEAELV